MGNFKFVAFCYNFSAQEGAGPAAAGPGAMCNRNYDHSDPIYWHCAKADDVAVAVAVAVAVLRLTAHWNLEFSLVLQVCRH